MSESSGPINIAAQEKDRDYPARSVAFLSRLLEAGVDVRFADLPMIEGATGKFLLQKMAAVAEVEAGTVSARPKTALAAAKRRGVSLRAIAAAQEERGNPSGARRQVVCGTGQPIVGGGPQPFRRKRRRHRRVKGDPLP